MNNPGDKNELFDASSMGSFLAAYAGRLHQALLAVDAAHGIDLEAEVAVITDDVPLGTSVAQAAQH